ncbi:MAG TPA: hypothetical protein DCY27_07095 [Desulfobacterales bacterium]|nr:hypothetical protein [Desulfobacterales bacterium]
MRAAGRAGHHTFFWVILLLILGIGVFFRLYGLGDRDLWTDEAWVALAATQPTAPEVLAAGKSTPPLYLLTVWEVGRLLGRSEAALRLTSCLLGIGALLLFWRLAGRVLPPGGALIALGLAAVSRRWVYFSKELKQYSADLFFAVLVFYLVERQLRRQGRGGWLLLTVLMALGLGFSHPLIFLLPVAAVVLWWELPDSRREIYRACGGLALIFAGYYWFFFRGQVDPELLIYWQADFPVLTSIGDFLWWLGGAWSRYGRYFFGFWGAPIALVFLLAGLIYWLKSSRPRIIWYFFGPLLFALAAAWAQRYPFMGGAGGVRLMMFSAPMLYLVVAAGIMAVVALGWRRWKIAGLILAAVVLIWVQPVMLWRENLHPRANREEIEPLVRYVQTHRRPADLIYVYYFAIHPFKFYYQGPQEQIVWGASCHERCLPLPPSQLRQIERVWLIFSHFETEEDIERFSRNLLGEDWSRQFEQRLPGAALFCYVPAQAMTAASF